MLTQNQLGARTKPGKGKRGWKSGAHRGTNVISRKRRTRVKRMTDPYALIFKLYKFPEFRLYNSLKKIIRLAWKGQLTATQRTGWKTAAAGATIRTWTGQLYTVTGYKLFQWHNYFKSAEAFSAGFPPQWADFTLTKTAPSPYNIPATPDFDAVLTSEEYGLLLHPTNLPEGVEGAIYASIAIQHYNAKRFPTRRYLRANLTSLKEIGYEGDWWIAFNPYWPKLAYTYGDTIHIGIRWQVYPAMIPSNPGFAVWTWTPPIP